MLPNQSSQLEHPGNPRAVARAVAIIPARGGSKGIPRKNLQSVHGQTLVGRAVRTSLAAEWIAKVYVSTEDSEIADEAERCGATVIPRPAELAADEALTEDVLLHALGMIHPVPPIVALVQCTAPQLTPEQIDGCINRLGVTGADVAAAAFPYHGLVCMQGYADRILGINWAPDHPVRRRQNMVPQWQIAGSVWAINTDRFLRRKTLASSDWVLCEVPRSIDIDTQADLDLVRKILATETGTTRAEEQIPYYPM